MIILVFLLSFSILVSLVMQFAISKMVFKIKCPEEMRRLEAVQDMFNKGEENEIGN